MKNTPHIVEAHVTLVSGTEEDISSVIFHLAPDKGWSINSSDLGLRFRSSEEAWPTS
jgi:hypothetical protein